MKKTKCTIYAPIREYSYFGNRSRSITRNIIEGLNFDIAISEYFSGVRIGNIDEIFNQFIKQPHTNPDVCIFFGNPTIYNKEGTKLNIGFPDATNIINESDIKLYINQCNMMDIVAVGSNYAKTTLQNLRYNENGKILKINTNIVVVSEYSVISEISNSPNYSLLDDVSSQKNFLLEGYWDVNISEFGGKNKDNIKYIIKNYLEAFKDIENAPGLILNVHGGIPSVVDMDGLNKKIIELIESIVHTTTLPKIYLLNGTLDALQIKSLYNDPKILALIRTPQRTDTLESELNFMSTGKPIIYSDFGAQTEILKYKGNVGVNCTVKELKLNNIDGSGLRLADIYGDYLKFALYEVFYHYNLLKSQSEIGAKEFLQKNTRECSLNLLKEIFK